MIGLLMVEDEEAIRQKLVQNINWAEHGFNLLSASNGLEALEILEQQPVEIMVTDIQMPKMNGIELIKEIKRRNYPMKIIVISGFAEFEYAQESIKLSVSDYLLKPFASRRLLEVVLRLKDELSQEAEAQQELNSMRKQLAENMVALREKLFMDLLGGNIPVENIGGQLEFLGLSGMANRWFQVAVFEIPENDLREMSEADKYLLNMQLSQQVSKVFNDSVYTYWTVNTRRNQVVVVLFDPPADLPIRLEELLLQLRLNLDHPLACGVGHSYLDLIDLQISYKEACSALQYRYLYGLNQVFSINDLNRAHPAYHKIFYQLHRHPIFDNVKIGASQAVRDDLRRLIDEMRQLQLSPELSKIVASNLVMLTYATLNELGYNTVETFGADFSILTAVNEAESLNDLEALLGGFLETINSSLHQKRSSLNHQLIDEIRQYIDEHFHEDITLSAMAAQYKISPGYLSLLFAERIGKKFIDYLTERRITKARELLKHTDMKIYEISSAVGYNDSFYFSNCFKKLTGHSPSEYREQMRIS